VQPDRNRKAGRPPSGMADVELQEHGCVSQSEFGCRANRQPQGIDADPSNSLRGARGPTICRSAATKTRRAA
jgi:hypothetical protein